MDGYLKDAYGVHFRPRPMASSEFNPDDFGRAHLAVGRRLTFLHADGETASRAAQRCG